MFLSKSFLLLQKNYFELQAKTEEQDNDDDGQFIERLLDDIDQTNYQSYPQKKRLKKRLKKPTNKDFSCNDCGKAFYFQVVFKPFITSTTNN